ncbi:MAG: hypothetical protein LBC20_11310, partial [Planctomycetaceae bacterium]|nr:hypothetical protein [Planctomycetaceae bacterium]
INFVGENCDKEYKILAAECIADLMAWTKMYSKAVEFYDLALNFFRAIRENGDEFVLLTEDEQRIIKNRINYKRGSIYKLAEQGRFTPDWLAYREAQRKHLSEESLLEAIWMYLDVTKNYPNTLSAEASECYVIKILTLFSNPAFVKEAAKRYEIILEELEDAKAHLRQAKRTAMAQPFMVGLETYVDRLKFVVKMWESTPFGRKALQQAEERAEKFLEKNKYGLYRGEVLLDIGTAHLVSFFDVENGEKWLTRAAEWFDNVQKFDKDLKDFELPESVRKVSQPPKEERYKDRWTNIKLYCTKSLNTDLAFGNSETEISLNFNNGIAATTMTAKSSVMNDIRKDIYKMDWKGDIEPVSINQIIYTTHNAPKCAEKLFRKDTIDTTVGWASMSSTLDTTNSGTNTVRCVQKNIKAQYKKIGYQMNTGRYFDPWVEIPSSQGDCIAYADWMTQAMLLLGVNASTQVIRISETQFFFAVGQTPFWLSEEGDINGTGTKNKNKSNYVTGAALGSRGKLLDTYFDKSTIYSWKTTPRAIKFPDDVSSILDAAFLTRNQPWNFHAACECSGHWWEITFNSTPDHETKNIMNKIDGPVIQCKGPKQLSGL